MITKKSKKEGAHKAPHRENQKGQGAPRIVVRDLVKTFQRRGGGGTVTPVDHVSLNVSPREMVVLLGPSGCGKTTLLRCIAGLERPDEGEIEIDGELVFSSKKGLFIPPSKRPSSMIFQSYALWPHMTVAANVAYPLQAKKYPKKKIRDRVTEVLALVDVDHLVDSYPGQISGGQQQRVALARAVVAGAEVILFDEPLSNVDAKVRETLRVELLAMQEEIGFSGLYVTHDQTEALALADRVAVLRDGVIEQLAPPREIYTEPNSYYVGNFIGTATTWQCKVREHTDSAAILDGPVGDVFVEPSQAHGYRPGDEVYVMFRPEEARISKKPLASRNNTWQAVISESMFMGAQSEYVVQVGEELIRVWTAGAMEFINGDEVWIHLPQSQLRVVPVAETDGLDAVEGP